MNRIDKIVVFKTLRPEHLEKILDIELGLVQQRILQTTGNNQFVFSCTPRVKSLLLEEGTDPKYGARHLKRSIEKNLVFPLANLVATAQIKLGDFIRIDLNDEGVMTFVKEAEGALVPVLLEKYGPEFTARRRPRWDAPPAAMRLPPGCWITNKLAGCEQIALQQALRQGDSLLQAGFRLQPRP